MCGSDDVVGEGPKTKVEEDVVDEDENDELSLL